MCLRSWQILSEETHSKFLWLFVVVAFLKKNEILEKRIYILLKKQETKKLIINRLPGKDHKDTSRQSKRLWMSPLVHKRLIKLFYFKKFANLSFFSTEPTKQQRFPLTSSPLSHLRTGVFLSWKIQIWKPHPSILPWIQYECRVIVFSGRSTLPI